MKSNIIANYLGQGWRVIMSIVFVPIYIKMMGAEAYGLVGAFAILQSSVAILDMGIRPAIARELARYTGGVVTHFQIWNLLRTVEIITLGISLSLFIVIFLLSDWLSVAWLNNEELSNVRISLSLKIIAAILALNFIESLYSNCLLGLQKQVVYNIVLIIASSMKGIGAIFVLKFVASDIEAFFYWQLTCVLLSGAAFAFFTYKILDRRSVAPKFAISSLHDSWRFAAGMMGVTLTALVLTQADKLLLSKYLPLEEFGYYTLAFLVANSLYTLITPVSQAYLPRLTEAVAGRNRPAICYYYHSGAQLVSALAGSGAIILCLYSERIIAVWTGDLSLSQSVAPVVKLLAIGTMLNGLLWMPFQIQIAYGWTRLSLVINIFLVAALVPLLYWVVPHHGVIGVAYVWITLNTLALITAVVKMHQKILKDQLISWLFKDVLKPLSVATIIALLLGRIFVKSEIILLEIINILIVLIVTIVCTFLLGTQLNVSVVYDAKKD